MIADRDTLLLFGGKTGHGNLTNQLWRFNISGKKKTKKIL
jgi:hypothetical protein